MAAAVERGEEVPLFSESAIPEFESGFDFYCY